LSEVRIPKALLVTALSVVSLAWVRAPASRSTRRLGLYGDLAWRLIGRFAAGAPAR